MTETTAQIGFHQIGLGGVLKQYRLVVPPNQREYSWTDREVVTLFHDFSKAIADGDNSYFLGTIVTIPRSLEILEVIDGQQRLATTAILLSEIRNYLLSNETLIAESITNEFLTVIDREKRARITKLSLNLDDNEFFRLSVTAGTNGLSIDRASHQRIANAFKEARTQIRKIVGPYDVKDHGDILNRWLHFIEHAAQVILLMVPTDVNAYKMFETLNDRGLKTSQSDLVKNYLFGQSAERFPEAQQRWALLRGTLESLDEDDITVNFLRHALIAIRGYLTAADVYETVQTKARGEQQSIAFLNALETLATLYVAIFNPEHEKWNSYPDSMRRAIQTLNLFNIRPFRPLMLAVSAKFNGKEAAAAFQALVIWGVRLILASSTRSGSVEQPLAAAAQSVFAGEIATVAKLKARLAGVIPADEPFKRAVEAATVSKISLARYYLRSLEMTAKDEATPWFIPNDDKQTINLEHVLPVKPDDSWNRFFPNQDTMQAYVRRLGNMVLLLAKSNADLANGDFETKKIAYAASPYELTRQISTVDDWTEAQIVERQKGLAELALRAWPL